MPVDVHADTSSYTQNKIMAFSQTKYHNLARMPVELQLHVDKRANNTAFTDTQRLYHIKHYRRLDSLCVHTETPVLPTLPSCVTMMFSECLSPIPSTKVATQ